MGKKMFPIGELNPGLHTFILGVRPTGTQRASPSATWPAISGIPHIGKYVHYTLLRAALLTRTFLAPGGLPSNNWLISRTALAQAKQTDLKYATARQLATMSIFFSNLIYRLGKKLMFRQIPIATANVYFKRFYAKNAICETDPFMVAACCVYVAAKVDETPIHIKSVVSEARATFSEFNYRGFPVDYTKLAEMEFYLLEDLEFDLIVYHPYRTLAAVCGREAVDAGEFPDHDDDDDDGGNARERGIRKAMVDGASSDAGDAAEKESDEMDRLFGRGSGKPGSDVEDSILQMACALSLLQPGRQIPTRPLPGARANGIIARPDESDHEQQQH
ncbi:hypothetical protein QFC19_001478 [Naganishia cerealis]|uniref:Uncharacterized protein n=1 Tax=Naganishia cerealis TaxID=610337 RepID=A0ACC2WFV8_9TREE|nr:hypothetical protein QFC19_001478 [Naganishia cerealis]